jgi:hypothetical protein
MDLFWGLGGWQGRLLEHTRNTKPNAKCKGHVPASGHIVRRVIKGAQLRLISHALFNGRDVVVGQTLVEDLARSTTLASERPDRLLASKAGQRTWRAHWQRRLSRRPSTVEGGM